MKNTFSGALRCMGSGYDTSYLYLNATASTVTLGPSPQVFTFAPVVSPPSPPLVPLIGTDYMSISYILSGSTYYLNGGTKNGSVSPVIEVYPAPNNPNGNTNSGTLWLLTQVLGNFQLNIMCLGSVYNASYIYLCGQNSNGNVSLVPNTDLVNIPNNGTYWLLC